MSKKKKSVEILPIFIMSSLFVVIDFLAFLVVGPFKAAGAVAFENPDDPLNREAGAEYKYNKAEFEKKAREWTKRYA